MKADNKVFVRLDALSVGYGRSVVVQGVRLDIEKGTVVALVGPNGSGKSTILKTIATELEALEGSVTIAGDDVFGMDAKTRARSIAVMLTDARRAGLMTCREVVESGRYPHMGAFGRLASTDNLAVEEAMRLCEVELLATSDFGRISDGQRQRVLIARAIAQGADLLVLDEPTSYLDVRHKLSFLGVLRRLARERGVCAIVSLHEIDLALKVADFVLCVKDGSVVAQGLAEDVLTEDAVRKLYGLEQGAYSAVTAGIEIAPNQSPPRVFVVGGAGSATATYRRLAKLGVSFSTGVLHRGDADEAVARALAHEVVMCPAFEPVGQEHVARAKKIIDGCEALVVCTMQWGSANDANRELESYAEARGIPVYDDIDALDMRLPFAR